MRTGMIVSPKCYSSCVRPPCPNYSQSEQNIKFHITNTYSSISLQMRVRFTCFITLSYLFGKKRRQKRS